jgi:hypothetical protein
VPEVAGVCSGISTGAAHALDRLQTASTGAVSLSVDYDAFGSITSKSFQSSPSGSADYALSFLYDGNSPGRLTSERTHGQALSMRGNQNGQAPSRPDHDDDVSKRRCSVKSSGGAA